MDPYKVLGVSRDADEETIKKAYRALVKKYHPDKYVNTPMADVASEKMKEINRAYDMITKGKTEAYSNGGSAYGGYGAYGGNQYGSYTQPGYQNVRMLLNMGRTAEAVRMLNTLPQNAEWYFLYGIACMRKGWYDKAIENLSKAVEMAPDNSEYRAALDNIQNRTASYTASPFNMSAIRCGICPIECCALLACTRCCC